MITSFRLCSIIVFINIRLSFIVHRLNRSAQIGKCIACLRNTKLSTSCVLHMHQQQQQQQIPYLQNKKYEKNALRRVCVCARGALCSC